MARRLPAFAVLLMAALAPWSARGDEPRGTLTAVVKGVRSDSGTVYCAIYGSADGFPRDYKKAVEGVKRPAKRGTVRCPFGPLPPGDYAVSVMHDENDNGTMDTKIFGIPKEGWGVSNNAGPHAFGPPTFEDARFIHRARAEKVTIRLRY